ncbi:ABC transporter permease [Brackiella oedipodis]|uniref:ABC transporter permease n=1 Tax=Brackiella oedipodis TaxID=124225 RepID=UPI000A06D7E5|nr:iron ABC transporter permease [Brackiella oedipodis]
MNKKSLSLSTSSSSSTTTAVSIFNKKHKGHKTRAPLWLRLLVFALTVPLLFPFLYLFLRSYDVGLNRAIELVFRERVWMLFSNTMILLVVVTGLSIVIGTVAAFALERYKIWGAPFFRVAATLPLCLPASVTSYTWISLSFKFEGLPGALLVMTMASAPLAYLPIAAVLKRMDRSLEEVSLSLGKSNTYTFWHVIFPQLKPALGSSFLLIALHMLIEFGAVSILNYNTFTTAIYQEYDMSFDNASAALLSLVLVVMCLIVVGFELIFRGNDYLAREGKGVARQMPRRALSPLSHALYLVFFIVHAIVALGIPIATLIYWLTVGTSFSGNFHLMEFIKSLGLSLGVSGMGAFVSVLVALPLVWCAIRYRSTLTIWIDRLPFLLHAMPGIVIALAITYFTIHYATPVYQTFVPMLIAYLMLYLPMAQTTLRSSLNLIPANIENVGKSLGRSDFFVFRTLIIPAILPGLTAAFALVFLNLMKELTATLVLSPVELQTLSIAVWEYTLDMRYAAVAPYACALIVFSGIPVYFLRKYGFK